MISSRSRGLFNDFPKVDRLCLNSLLCVIRSLMVPDDKESFNGLDQSKSDNMRKLLENFSAKISTWFDSW